LLSGCSSDFCQSWSGCGPGWMPARSGSAPSARVGLLAFCAATSWRLACFSVRRSWRWRSRCRFCCDGLDLFTGQLYDDRAVLSPTRELAAQIVEDLNDIAVHTPLTAAAVFGGVGMGPQEHAFRSGVDVIVGTPGRLLDHFRSSYAKLGGLQYLVLDEADRML